MRIYTRIQILIFLMTFAFACLGSVQARAHGIENPVVKCLRDFIGGFFGNGKNSKNFAEGLPDDFPAIEEGIPSEPLTRPTVPQWVWDQLPASIHEEIRLGKREPPFFIENGEVHEFVGVRADPETTGYLWRFRVRDGMVEREFRNDRNERETKLIPIAKTDEAGFQGVNGLNEILPLNPTWFRDLGFSMLDDGTVEFPDIVSLDGRSQKMRKINPTQAPYVSHYYSGAGEIGYFEYVRNWARGRMVVGVSPREFFHDLQVHGFGFLLFPAQAVRISRLRAKLLMELFESISGTNSFRQIIDKLIQEEAARVDSASVEIRTMFDPPEKYEGKNYGPKPIADVLGRLAGEISMHSREGEHFIDRINAVISTLSPEERKKAQKIVRSYSIRPISGKKVKELEREIEQRFRRH